VSIGVYSLYSKSDFAGSSGLIARYILYVPEAFMVSLGTDANNEKYCEQMLCLNSKFRITPDPSQHREPLIALLLSLFTVPGLGNIYAGNIQGGLGIMGIVAEGGIIILAADPISRSFNSWNAKSIIQYFGIGIMALSKLVDVITAPSYAAIHNAVYSGEKMDNAGKIDLHLTPLYDKEITGLKLSLAY
jgi:TM2 domain-containing membrane protein YozV